MTWEKYYRPQTAAEALNLLLESKGNARVVAGGTDLMLQVRKRQFNPKGLVDLSRVEELRRISENGNVLSIGSMVTHQELAESKLIREKARALADAARSVGSPQIRRVGTIGGNVVNAQPAADTTIALMAFDAQARVLTAQGEQTRPLAELFRGPGQSAVDPTAEIVLGFEFPSPDKLVGTAFRRLAKRQALALPIVNVAVRVQADQSVSRFDDVRMALGPMAPVPLRAVAGEEALKGTPLAAASVEAALAATAKEINPRDSIRGSALYKRKMVLILLKRALMAAVTDLGGEIKE